MDGTGDDAPAASSSPSAKVSAGNCPNCQDPFAADDVFCENCGYDFATGTLPDQAHDQPNAAAPPAAAETPVAAAAAASATPPTSAATAGAAEGTTVETPVAAEANPSSEADESAAGTLTAVVGVDRSYFDEIVGGADLDFPDPEPTPVRVPLSGAKILVGRLNESRGVFPELDVKKLTQDPAVSTRHAMLQRTDDGTWTITDLGSTNGTLLDEKPSPIAPGTPIPVDAGTSIYVGAFTRITLEA